MDLDQNEHVDADTTDTCEGDNNNSISYSNVDSNQERSTES